MIGRLRGRVLEDEGDGALVLDVQGVGYAVTLPLGSLGRIESVDEQITLHVHTHFRDGAIELYGFATGDERTAFRTLITIPKVGPKLAMAVLGSLTVGDLATCVSRGEVGRLTKVPGVGKKTAERMVLELEGKLSGLTPTTTAAARIGPAKVQGQVVVEALVRMGFKPAEAERAVASLDDVDQPLSDLIRAALAVLSR